MKALQTCNGHPQRAGNRCLLVGAACGTSAASADELNKTLPPDPARKQPAPKGKEQDT